MLTVLLLVVWIGNGWWNAEFLFGGHFGIMVNRGAVEWVRFPPNAPPLATRLRLDVAAAIDLTPWIETSRFGKGWDVTMPLWPASLLSLLATAAAWRGDAKYLRRVREGACPACGYDRAGLAAGAVCPECGAAAWT